MEKETDFILFKNIYWYKGIYMNMLIRMYCYTKLEYLNYMAKTPIPVLMP